MLSKTIVLPKVTMPMVSSRSGLLALDAIPVALCPLVIPSFLSILLIPPPMVLPGWFSEQDSSMTVGGTQWTHSAMGEMIF